MSSKRILVTGGAGFVGSHTVDALLRAGHYVRIYDALTPQVHPGGAPEYLARDAELIRGDMRDPDKLRDAVRGMDVIYHLAAAVGVGQSMYEIAHYLGVNTLGTANLLQVMLDTRLQVEKLIVASSMSIYGEGTYRCAECGAVTPGPRANARLMRRQWDPACPRCQGALTPVPTDEAKPLQCTSYYALSKKDQEEMALLFGRTYQVPVVALRYFNIYGTRQALSNPYTGVAAIFAARLLNGKAPLVFEDGAQQRDFVSVHDVVQANLLAMKHAAADGLALNIGSGQPVMIREIAEVLAQQLGNGLPADLTGKYCAGDIRHCFADISAARRVLGYQPRIRFAEGIRELVEWLRPQTAQDRAAEAVQQLEFYRLTA